MPIQWIPGTRVILRLANGKLMQDCCCSLCHGNCCCDVTIPPWFQPPLVITINEIIESTETTSINNLSCLVGDWVLPYSNESVGLCTWKNTFSPGVDPESAVFSIKAQLINTVSSINHSVHEPNGCLKITIEFLSCKDCNGNVLNRKPIILYVSTQSSCSLNVDQSSLNNDNNCACNRGSQNRLIEGDFEADGFGYQGLCWNHPDADTSGGYLYFESPQLWDGVAEVPNPETYVNGLSSLEISVRFDKDTSEGSFCTWTTEDVYFNDPLEPNLSPSNEACSYVTEVNAGYTLMSGVSLVDPDNDTLTVYGGNMAVTVNCDGESDIWLTLGEVEVKGVGTYYIRVRVRWEPDAPASCNTRMVFDIPPLPCPTPQPPFDMCTCSPSNCSGGLFPIRDRDLPVAVIRKVAFPTPNGTSWVTPAVSDMPGPDTIQSAPVESYCPTTGYPVSQSINGSYSGFYPPDETNADCTCPNLDFCACVGFEAYPPDELVANDFAPFGARYEILYRVVLPNGDDWIYSLVYTKTRSATPLAHPRGLWIADWALPSPPFNSRVYGCECVDNCDGFITAGQRMYQVSTLGRVPPRSLSIGGVSAKPQDPNAEDISLLVNTYGNYRLQQEHDQCCVLCTGYDYPCTNWYCNDCDCFATECTDKLVHARSGYCCRCAAVEHVTVNTVGSDCSGCNYTITVDCAFDNVPTPYSSGVEGGNLVERGSYTCMNSRARALVCNYVFSVTDAPGCSLVSVTISDCSSKFSCYEQRWVSPTFINVVHGPIEGSPCGVVSEEISYKTGCSGDIVQTYSTNCSCGEGLGSQTREDVITFTLANIPDCDPGFGTGSTYMSIEPDQCPVGRAYNCQRIQLSGTALFRMGPVDESDEIAYRAETEPLKMLLWLFPGNGDAVCQEIFGIRITANANPWDGTKFWLYAYFSFSFDYTACSEFLNPVIAFGDFCPYRPGQLVEFSIFDGATITKGEDPACDDPDCLLGIKL